MQLSTITTAILTLTTLCAQAQEKAADTVIVPLAESSKIIFTVGDRNDLDVLRHYNFQQLFIDIIDRLDPQDSARVTYQAPEELGNAEPEEWTDTTPDEKDTDEGDSRKNDGRRGIGRTRHSYNIDLGTNNYLTDDQFPDGNEAYAVRPWGSWYLAGNSVQRTKLGKHVFVEWTVGVSWYSFKFQDDNTRVMKDDLGVHFAPDERDVDFIKSKLSATFINASLVPLLDFSERGARQRIWDNPGNGFRFGAGPYVGYRISSKSKLVYEVNGDRKKEKDRDNFYLNNLRYGVRFQIGVRSTDIFINYDMNELFTDGRGPRLNAISFGLIL